MEGSIFGEIKKQREGSRREREERIRAFQEICMELLRTLDSDFFTIAVPGPGSKPSGLRGESLPSTSGLFIDERGAWFFKLMRAWDREKEEIIEIEDPLDYFFTPKNGSVPVCLSYKQTFDHLAQQREGATTRIQMSWGESFWIDGVTIEDLSDPLRLATHFLIGLVEERKSQGRPLAGERLS